MPTVNTFLNTGLSSRPHRRRNLLCFEVKKAHEFIQFQAAGHQPAR
jgi:hypothetical protein